MKRVESIEELIELAQQKKAVLMAEPQGVRVPAAFVINMPLIKVYHLHLKGIYIYKSKQNEHPRKRP